jgi:glycerophosphoryl diester phosphodiesterase
MSALKNTSKKAKKYLCTPSKMLIAHRGVHGSELKENTLEAFYRAMTDNKCDGFECDLRLTSDGEIVIHHDPNLKGGLSIEDIHSVELPPDVCFLRELLTLISDLDYQGCVNLEVKTYKTGNLAIKMIHTDFPKLDHHRILFTSFLHPEIVQMKHTHPDFCYGLLLACQPIQSVLDQLFDTVDCIVIRESVVDWDTLSNIPPDCIYLWTVNCPNKIKNLRENGYHVISDVIHHDAYL